MNKSITLFPSRLSLTHIFYHSLPDPYDVIEESCFNQCVCVCVYIHRCLSSSPGPSHPFVVVLRIHGQYGDPGADVDQQHGEGVVQRTGLLHAALRV